MKKNLLLIIACTIGLMANGQSSDTKVTSTKSKPTKSGQKNLMLNVTSIRKTVTPKTLTVGCDTLTNFDFTTMTPTNYTVTTGGYVSGQNFYGDLAKADVFTVSNNNSTVDGTYIVFGTGVSSGTGQTATVKVWSDAGGLPSTELGSATISYDSIAAYAANLTEMWVDFTPDIPVSAGPIYVGVEFSYNAGDTLSMVTCADGEIATGTAYELFSDGTWHAYSETVSWGLNVTNVILPVICTATGINEATNVGGVKVFPNPAESLISVQVKKYDNSTVRIFDVTGIEIYNALLNEMNTTVDVSTFAAGLYLVKVEGKDFSYSEKLTVK